MNPVTKKEIFEAADILAEEGIMPAIMSVRELIGNRGSETTLAKYLKEWKTLLLKKNSVGCVFCEALTHDNLDLKEQLALNNSKVDQLKEILTLMLEQPDRKMAVEEIITRLQ